MVLGVCAKFLLFTRWYTHKLCNIFCLPTVQCSMVLRVCVQSVNMSTFWGQTRERRRGTDVWILQRSKIHFFSSNILERSGLWCDMWSILLWTLCVFFQIMFFVGTKLFSFTKLRKKGKGVPWRMVEYFAYYWHHIFCIFCQHRHCTLHQPNSSLAPMIRIGPHMITSKINLWPSRWWIMVRSQDNR